MLKSTVPYVDIKQVGQNQVSLRSLIYVLMCCALGGTLGCRPNPLGDFIPKPHLRFAAVLTIFAEKCGRFGENIDV